MIEASGLTKRFGKTAALDDISFKINEGQVFGLIGSNGSGKSTLLRILSGVYYPDGGAVAVDNMKVFDNPALKSKIFFLSDTPYFFTHANLLEMADFYSHLYPDFSYERLDYLNRVFPIDKTAKIANMSKGMQRQAALILAFAACPKYLLLDEAFDGLDPVMRNTLKGLITADISDRNATVIIASHNLRELEDMCDRVGLLHHGKVVFNDDLDSLRDSIHKIQVAFQTVPDTDVFNQLQLLKMERTGSLVQIVARGDIDEIEAFLRKLNPIFFERLQPTLEELFILELGGVGYETAKIIE